MARAQVWISPKENGGWRVHKPGDQRDIAHLGNKEGARERAIEIAKRHNAELFEQNKNGQIASRRSYGRDPFPPRG